MRIPKKALRDCEIYKVVDGQDGTIEIECNFGCDRCGFNEKIDAERRKRIKAHDWSWDEERNVAYLALHDGV